MRGSLVVIGRISKYTISWDAKGDTISVVWAVHQDINTIRWLANWAWHLTIMGLTILDIFSSGATNGVIMAPLGYKTFLLVDKDRGWLDSVSLKPSTQVEEMVPFIDSMLAWGRILLLDSSI